MRKKPASTTVKVEPQRRATAAPPAATETSPPYASRRSGDPPRPRRTGAMYAPTAASAARYSSPLRHALARTAPESSARAPMPAPAGMNRYGPAAAHTARYMMAAPAPIAAAPYVRSPRRCRCVPHSWTASPTTIPASTRTAGEIQPWSKAYFRAKPTVATRARIPTMRSAFSPSQASASCPIRCRAVARRDPAPWAGPAPSDFRRAGLKAASPAARGVAAAPEADPAAPGAPASRDRLRDTNSASRRARRTSRRSMRSRSSMVVSGGEVAPVAAPT